MAVGYAGTVAVPSGQASAAPIDIDHDGGRRPCCTRQDRSMHEGFRVGHGVGGHLCAAEQHSFGREPNELELLVGAVFPCPA